jgi:hypothetical protein
MNNLTIALACLGGVLLTGLVAHGAWQARKAGSLRPLQPQPHQHREPVFGETVFQSDVLLDPPAQAGSHTTPGPMVNAAKRVNQQRIDALIDAIATLRLEAPISGDLALAHLPTTRRAGTKSLLIEGLNTESGEWETPVPNQRYSEFQAGLQLANRTGALNEIEYSEFIQKIQIFAENIKAMADFPDMLDVVARGRELDNYASAHDAQLAVHLHARAAAWSVGYVQQHAAQHGFVSSLIPGRMVLPSPDESAPPWLTLHFDPQAALAEDPNLSSVRDLTLSFDVPQTPAAQSPFITWQNSAQALAKDMDALIVDDHSHPITPESFEAIGGELGQLYDALQLRDLGAGSMAARRLFG